MRKKGRTVIMRAALFDYTGSKAGRYSDIFRDIVRAGKVGAVRVVDCFVGAGNLSAATLGFFESHVVNDLDPRIAIIYKVIAREELHVRFKSAVLSHQNTEEGFKECKELSSKAKELFNSDDIDDMVEVAAACFCYKNWAFNGIGYTRSASRAGNTKQLCSKLQNIEYYKGFDVCNMDYLSLMAEELENPELVKRSFYIIDPPYLEANPRYQVGGGATRKKYHEKLIETLYEISARNGKWALCGYPSELYREALEDRGFNKFKVMEKAKSCEIIKKGEARQFELECLWTSFKI